MEQTASYELPLSADVPPAFVRFRAPAAGALSEDLLLRNVLWFCSLRWIAIALLGLVGLLSLWPGVLNLLGLQAPAHWPLVAAAVLGLENLGFRWHGYRLGKSGASPRARLNLWGQIVIDLLILTAVVHFTGSLQTYVAFVYLFHIVLACIFFSPPSSLIVTSLASVLYVGCVLAEQLSTGQPVSIYAQPVWWEIRLATPWAIWINVGSALGIWLVVWYLASHLSGMIRQRDAELAETNRRLRETQQERTWHMLRTTHELKAPFAAIHANAQLLLKGYCGPLSGEAREALERISARARRLANEIQEMLQLANLRSGSAKLLPCVELDVAAILRWARSQIQPLADERGVTFQEEFHDGRTKAVEDHLKMLFINVLTNAVVYSHRGGLVGLACSATPDGPVVAIEDHGIGIPADKLPHIFEEYYRTTEAVQHNQQSSGLGLAIVRQVAEDHHIRIRVSSQVSVGTRFELTLPSASREEGGENPATGRTVTWPS